MLQCRAERTKTVNIRIMRRLLVSLHHLTSANSNAEGPVLFEVCQEDC